MKKLYVSMFALAMGACITAGARTYQRADVNFEGMAKTFQPTEKLMLSDMKVAKSVAKVKANAGEEWNNLGTGIFIEGIFGLGQINVTVEESATTPGYYRVPDAFTGFDPAAQPFEIDATDPNCVNIPEQETGLNLSIDLEDGSQLSGMLSLMSFSTYVTIMGESMADYPQYNITMENGVITMPEGCIIGLFGDNDTPVMLNSEMILALPGADYVPEWGEVKTGQMLDTFFESLFQGYEPAEVDVLIQKNNKTEGVYRVIDPWYVLLADEGTTPAPNPAAGYYFFIDASHPECVVVPYQSSGIRTSRGPVYVMSMSANYETIEDFLASEDAGCNFTMDVDTRTINFTGSEVKLSDGSTSFVGPLFFVYPQSENPNSMYVLSNFTTPGYIKLPEFTGISSVAVDNNNAEAEYYNIQGVRVNNPVAGQLYIVKKGNEVSKTIIR